MEKKENERVNKSSSKLTTRSIAIVENSLFKVPLLDKFRTEGVERGREHKVGELI